MQKISPYLWFDDQAEEAIQLYTSIFKNSKIGSITRFSEDVPGPKGKVITVTFELAGQEFLAINGGPEFKFTPSVSFFVRCETEAEIDTLWQALSAGGSVLMDLDRYPFSEKFAWVADKYGVSWQLDLARVPQKIDPFLLFVGEQHGKAEEAIRLYTSLFKDSSITRIVPYSPGTDEPEGSVMHAVFILNGQEFMAMDSSAEHNFSFTPAISFFVTCRDQAEVDYFWERLSTGGEKGPCGWLKDKFGVSWQIIPTVLGELINDPDPEKASRVTQAMLKMSKIEIEELQRAYEQG
jgi:predicted 3-demethylubiquinone-9 3-methyltransferase (glyoxalase superfamily)